MLSCKLHAGVDSSSAAIALAEENRILNRIRNEQCSFVAADISDFMREAREAGQVNVSSMGLWGHSLQSHTPGPVPRFCASPGK